MASADQPDEFDQTEETIPSYRWVLPYAAMLIGIAIGAVILAVHIMAVPTAGN